VRIARPAKRAANPLAILAAASSMSMAVLTSPSPSQVPFHPQTAAKPPRFVLGRRFSAETGLINPEESYQPVKRRESGAESHNTRRSAY
jgi:hypothetical protein